MNGKAITFRDPIDDPFIRGRVVIGWRDLLWSLFRGSLTVEVTVSGDMDRMNDVLELDANALITNSSRRTEFDGQVQESLKEVIE